MWQKRKGMASLDSKKADEMRQFLIDNRLTLADFEGDPEVERYLAPQFKQDRQDLIELGRQQASLYGGNPAVKEQFHQRADELRRRQRNLLQMESAKSTMGIAAAHPRSFKNRLETSRSAEQELAAQPYTTGGLLSGALAGGVTGNAVGKLGARAKRVNPRFFGPVGAVAGATVGSFAGIGAGKKLNEHVSGRRYDEIKAPYEIARGLKDVGQ